MQWKSTGTIAKTLHKVQELRFIFLLTINCDVQPNTNLDQSSENKERKT